MGICIGSKNKEELKENPIKPRFELPFIERELIQIFHSTIKADKNSSDSCSDNPMSSQKQTEKRSAASRCANPGKRMKRRAALDIGSDEDRDSDGAEETAHQKVVKEFSAFQEDRGIPMFQLSITVVVEGEMHYTYPTIWTLSEHIFSIPAMSAPADRVFSTAAHIINKKRSRFTPEHANLLIFLKENSKFVDWQENSQCGEPVEVIVDGDKDDTR